MNRFIYKGQPTNLARFGLIKAGDLLVMDDNESDDISGDPRFQVVAPNAKLPPRRDVVPITDKMTPLQKEAAEKANREERARLVQLDKANNSDHVAVLEIKGKSYEQLTELANDLNVREGREVVNVKRSSRAELIRVLVNNRREQQGKAPIEVDEE